MDNEETFSLEDILRLCESAAPNPWYPSAHARSTGKSRDRLDPLLNELRVAGLIRLTDWVPDNGQGYVLTPAGEDALNSTRALHKLRSGQVPAIDHPEEAPPRLEGRTGTPWARGEAVRDAMLGSFTPVVTIALLLLNITAFVFGIGLAAAR